MVNFLPVYLATVLKVELCSMSSLTFIIAIMCHLFCIAFNKLLCGCSTKLKTKSFNSFGFVLSAVLFFLLVVLPPDSNFVETSRIILLLSLLPIGFTTLGFIYSSVIYGRFFTQNIVSAMQLPFSLAMTFVPFLVVFVTVDNALPYWRLVYAIIAAILVVGAGIFALLTSAQPASWAENSWDPTTEYKMRSVEYVSRTEECGLLELRRLDGPEPSEHVDQY